jgi:NodT family efflux transporter outer membrane factor (OMF) lipoprotein
MTSADATPVGARRGSAVTPCPSGVARLARAAGPTAAALLGLLAGCQVGPDFKRPDPPKADRYTANPLQVESGATALRDQQIKLGATPERQWWHLFQSDSLDAVVERALQGNHTLVEANATLAQARELAAAQAGSLYPQLAMTAGAGRQRYGAEFLGPFPKPPPFNYYALGPTVSYALDYTGGTARSVEQQYALAEYQRQQLNAAYLMVSGNAIMQSLRIALLRGEISTVEAILEEDRQNRQLVQVAFQAGSVSRVDVVSAESQLASDATLLPPLRQELAVARHALSLIMGQLPADAAPPEIELSQVALPHDLPVSLPSELVHQRPDILASEAQLHAATAAVGVAAANLYPHIVLSGSLGLQSTTLGTLFAGGATAYGLTGSLTAPLFEGGTLRAQKRAAVDTLRASTARYEETVLSAFGQVADALEALDHDAELLDAQAHAQDAARENVDLTRKSYNEGNVGVLQVLDAERLYQNARLGYVRAQAQRYMDTVQLFMALGGSAPGGQPPQD